MQHARKGILRANVRAIRRQPVTFCHRPLEGPFFRVLGGGKTLRRVSVRMASRRLRSTHTQGYLARGIPVPWGHPQNIPKAKNSQTRMFAVFPENIPKIPKIPTRFWISGDWLANT